MGAERTDLIIPAEREERVRAYVPPVLNAANSDSAILLQIMERAVREPSFDMDRIEKLIAAKERLDAARERQEQIERQKAFVNDMAEFKKNPPVIFKNKHVRFKSERTGNWTDYHHATHDEVTLKIVAGLSQYGFSHRWVPTQPDGQVRVTLIITHRLGHSEELSLQAPPDTTGNKSPAQAIVSTKTLLERHTLLAATGLTSADMPDEDDKDQPEKPGVPNDVWVRLGDAAKEGETALRGMWEALSPTTQDILLDHYKDDWEAIKQKAVAADSANTGAACASKMRTMMAQDLDENVIAKQVYDENNRLNADAQQLLNAAWNVLAADERRAWKAFVDMEKANVRKQRG